jgi:hypothetical protein
MGLFGAIGSAIKGVGGGIGKAVSGVAGQVGKLPGMPGGGGPPAPARPITQPPQQARQLSQGNARSAGKSRAFSAQRRF